MSPSQCHWEGFMRQKPPEPSPALVSQLSSAIGPVSFFISIREAPLKMINLPHCKEGKAPVCIILITKMSHLKTCFQEGKWNRTKYSREITVAQNSPWCLLFERNDVSEQNCFFSWLQNIFLHMTPPRGGKLILEISGIMICSLKD